MRLTVTGPQNTGKTTFIKDFLSAFPGYFSPKETYRDVIRNNRLKVNRETTQQSQKLIRDFLYQQIFKNKKKNVIFDRCVLDNLVYSYYQYELGKFSKKFIDESEKMMFDSLKRLDVLIFIPTGVSVPLKEDYLRDTDVQFIDSINRLFVSMILEVARKSKIKIAVVTGNRKLRIDQIKKLISGK
jgi:predicted ATPase